MPAENVAGKCWWRVATEGARSVELTLVMTGLHLLGARRTLVGKEMASGWWLSARGSKGCAKLFVYQGLVSVGDGGGSDAGREFPGEEWGASDPWA